MKSRRIFVMKKWNKLLVVPLTVALFAACDNGNDDGGATDDGDAEVTTAATQVIVENEETLVDAVGENGAWILIINEDLETSEELVLIDGYENDGEPERKLALYEQDEDRNITASYTLTAPRITIEAENTRIQGGTFVGDVYVEANNFSIPDATIEGDVIFASEEFEQSANLDGGTVTGEVRVEE